METIVPQFIDGMRQTGLLEYIAVFAGIAPSPDVRRAVRNLVSARFPEVSVLAYEELPPELPVRPVGRVALAA